METPEYTKIIATIGPATNSVDAIRQLIRAGAACCRVNFSHGGGEMHGPVMDSIRQASHLEGKLIAILADIQGPKLRIGAMPRQGVLLVEGQTFTLTPRKIEGNEALTYTAHERLCDDVEPGARILLADGIIELEVTSVADGDVHTKVLTGGRLFSNKGLNLPGRPVSLETLSSKDRRDLTFLSTSDVDMVAISFVRSANDLKSAREILGTEKRILLMAKLERPEAIVNLDEILDASDGIMVARGDLGVELPFEQVPVLQKQILKRATDHGKFAVVATQMLASMVSSRRPSRAEASDVLNAVLDGADAVMLSEETAIGENPVLAVKAMHALTHAAEDYGRKSPPMTIDNVQHSFAAGAAGAAVRAAERLNAKAIVTLGGSGLTALHVSKWRPPVPIVSLSSGLGTLRRLNMLRGVRPLQMPNRAEMEDQLATADRFLIESGWAKPGDVIVSASAVPLGMHKETNMIRFHRVRAEGEPRTNWPPSS
jgi:pyruvate kinase